MRIYADTSVFGGVFDQEFVDETKLFFEMVDTGRFTLVTSSMVEDEIVNAPQKIQDFFSAVTANIEYLELTQKVFDLVDVYLAEGILTPKSVEDATHVALAAISRCDIIVSWNCKHIVNPNKIPQYNVINVNQGYGHLNIVTPGRVMKYGQ